MSRSTPAPGRPAFTVVRKASAPARPPARAPRRAAPPARAPARRERPSARPLWAIPVALLLIASAAVGAVTITYNTSSTNNLTLRDPPIQWVGGPDSSGNNYVASFSLSANKTFYSITLKPVPEANVTWGNLTTLSNNDTVPYGVTITGTSVNANAKILDFRVEFRNYGTDAIVGTLNLKDASPSLNLGSLAAGARHYAKMYVKLDTNTNQADLPASVSLTINITV